MSWSILILSSLDDVLVSVGAALTTALVEMEITGRRTVLLAVCVLTAAS